MTRAALAFILAVGVAAPAVADVTIRQTTTGKGLGMSGTTSGTSCSSSSTVTGVSAGPLADDLFAGPAGDKLKERR